MSTTLPDAPEKRLCFVVGPIGHDGTEQRKHADFLLHGIVKPVLEAEVFGYRVKRSDEDPNPGMIGDRMITDIINADLVVADLTDLNPNAFYELGIRHAAEKPAIHVAKAGTVLPFDNAPHSTIFVDVSDWRSIEHARTRLAASARAIEAPEYQVSNPITQANASFRMRDSADPRDRVIADMQSQINTIEREVRELVKVGERQSSLAPMSLYLARDLEPTQPNRNVFRDIVTGRDLGSLEECSRNLTEILNTGNKPVG